MTGKVDSGGPPSPPHARRAEGRPKTAHRAAAPHHQQSQGTPARRKARHSPAEAITAPIIGASRPGQLDASLAAVSYPLDADLKQQLDDLIHEYRMGDAAR